MVPFQHMQRLHEAVVTPRCTWVEFTRSRHMDAYAREPDLYWNTLDQFMKQYAEPTAAAAAAAVAGPEAAAAAAEARAAAAAAAERRAAAAAAAAAQE